MNDLSTSNAPSHKFRVKVGLAECTVTCEDKEAAVQMARRQLCDEMPHMVTVIRGIRDKEFRVDQVG
jgi:hypothetical protein